MDIKIKKNYGGILYMKKILYLITFLILFNSFIYSSSFYPVEFKQFIINNEDIPERILFLSIDKMELQVIDFSEQNYRIIHTYPILSNNLDRDFLQKIAGLRSITEWFDSEQIAGDDFSGKFYINYPDELERNLDVGVSNIEILSYKKTQATYNQNDIVISSEAMDSIFLKHDYILIATELKYLNDNELNDEVRMFLNSFNKWQNHWKNQEIYHYLAFYHNEFYSKTNMMNLSRWSKQKSAIFSPEKNISIDFTNFFYIFRDNVIYLECLQDYKAPHYNDFGKKVMVWKYENENWNIWAEDWYEVKKYSSSVVSIEPEFKDDLTIDTEFKVSSEVVSSEADKLLADLFNSEPVKKTEIAGMPLLTEKRYLLFTEEYDEYKVSLEVNNNISSFVNDFQLWQEAWTAQNIKNYLSFYSGDFYSRTANMGIEAWTSSKTRLFSRNQTIKLEFSNFSHSWNADVIYIEFLQDYQAGSYKDFGTKRMIWKKYTSGWKIVTEDWFAKEKPVVVEPVIPIEPPVIIEVPVVDTLRLAWEKHQGKVPYEYINFLFPKLQNYDDYLIIVEKKYQHAALYKFSNNFKEISLLKTYLVSSGQANGNKLVRGDLKTPEGLYVTQKYIPGRTLDKKYGSGAFTLDYPNELDKLRRKTGSGIWIHGSDIGIVPFDTEGCVRFENDEIDYFYKVLNLDKTPLIINEKIEWVEVSYLENQIQIIQEFLNDWEDSWEKQDLDRYLAFYCDQEFVSHRQKMDFEKWKNHKQRVFSPEKHIILDFYDFDYYYADDLLLISFFQDYYADSYNDFGKKQIVFKRFNNSWKIIQEEWSPAVRGNGHRKRTVENTLMRGRNN